MTSFSVFLFFVDFPYFPQFSQIVIKCKKSVRIEDCYFDIPDSDGESSICDHPLESSNYLTKLELAQIIKSKVEKLKKLYKSELDRTNLDLIRADRNDTKNISYHFLKQSLTGNEVIVRKCDFKGQKCASILVF